MGYYVDRVVICDAYQEPDRHYELLPGGRSELQRDRRPSMRYLASAKDSKGGISAVIGNQERLDRLTQDSLAPYEQRNEFVNQLREEIRAWRNGTGKWLGSRYGGTSVVTRRLLEWWFERDDERKAEGKRFFFCQREAAESVIYLFEAQNRQRMSETGDLVRYALKMATGTGKTLVMALLIVWSTLHRRRVSGSSLSANFLVLTPNITVRDRVAGMPRGDGLDPSGTEDLYDAFDMIPPEYRNDFHPNVLVRNWQSIQLENRREDWIPEGPGDESRFIPAAVLWALQRRSQMDPDIPVRRLLGNWHDLVVINDEAHHVYGEKRARKGEEPDYIKWNKIIERIRKVARISFVVDLSATPWYGSGSPKPEGTLFEWLISDFSVYDAFESGLVKVVRLPEERGQQRIYLDLWDKVKQARTKPEYLSACRGAIEHLYSSWSQDYLQWKNLLLYIRGPAPVMLIVLNDATRAAWVFEHVSRDYDLLRNPDTDDPRQWVTIQVDSKVFDANEGKEAVLRAMVNTVGKHGMPGEKVRCIISVNMLSEGWDVKSVTHILGVRAFGSPLLTEQVIGRGLRLTNYDILNQPLGERPLGSEETVDAFGIPFVGFPVEKRKRTTVIDWSQKPVWVETQESKEKYRIRIPNVRSWAVAVTKPLSEVIRLNELPELIIDPKQTPPEVVSRPVVGAQPEAIHTLAEFRRESPLVRTTLELARDLHERLNPTSAGDPAFGPLIDEVLPIVGDYVRTRISASRPSDVRDVGIMYWREKVLDTLETAIRAAQGENVRAVPVLGTPEYLDSANLRKFQWTGLSAEGAKCHTNVAPCHSDLERLFAEFLNKAPDVKRYLKNERFGFSVTYYENNRPRQYYPDFIVEVQETESESAFWLCETKGEMFPNTPLKREAAEIWCRRMTTAAKFGSWRYLFAQQKGFETSLRSGLQTFIRLARSLGAYPIRS